MNRSSATIWFPPIEKELPVPKTISIPYDHGRFVGALEGELEYRDEEFRDKLMEISVACGKIGWPCFIRTDLTSAKHSGPTHYLIKSPFDVETVIMRTVEDNEMKLWPFARPSHFMIREFLDLNHSFTAFEDLPIAREFRLFANQNEVLCVHPYWPGEALRFREEPGSWVEELAKHHEIPSNIEDIKAMAIRACQLIGADHNWSVDFAQGRNGAWWLIDMAHADESYHWEGCNAATYIKS